MAFDFFKFIVMIVCFIVLVSVLMRQNLSLGGPLQACCIFFLIAASCFLALNLLLFYFSLKDESPASVNQIHQMQKLFLTILGYFLFLSFSVVCIIFLVSSVLAFLSFYSSQSQIVRWILSGLLICLGLYLFFQIVSALHIYEKSPLVRLVVDVICYIPCSIFGVLNGLLFPKTKWIDVVWLLVGILLLVLYVMVPVWEKKYYYHGGTQLVNMPQHLETQQSLGSSIELNKSTTFDYQYAISCWIYLDATSPNYTASSNQDVPVLDYGGKPTLFYNVAANTLKVVMKIKDREKVVYVKKRWPLQKWNHVVIQYTGGTLDIFVNNRLVKSVRQIVPYMDYDALTVGSEGGVHGSICNVVYFNKSISIQKINQLYETVQGKTPPVVQ
jgi:hypothetical protein